MFTLFHIFIMCRTLLGLGPAQNSSEPVQNDQVHLKIDRAWFRLDRTNPISK